MANELKKLLKEADKTWEILKKFPMYKNKTKEDYIQYVKTTYAYYNSLSEEQKIEYNKLKETQFKKALEALDNRKNDTKNKNK